METNKHVEPGVVDSAKIVLSYATAAGAAGITGKMALDTIRNDGGVAALAARSVIATVLVFSFFQVFPHYPVGVSEVHFILGSTLFLLFGGGAAAIGLALGLLFQGVFFEPIDLPQYGMNVTTLLVPLWALSMLAKRIIPANTAYVDIKYTGTCALDRLSGRRCGLGGILGGYGQGFGAATLASVASFGAAYMLVIVLEPIADLAVLYVAKTMGSRSGTPLFDSRLNNSAA